MNNGSVEMRSKAYRQNHPGFEHPLTFSPLQEKHTDLMMTAIWKSHTRLRNYIGWAKYVRRFLLHVLNVQRDLKSQNSSILNRPKCERNFSFASYLPHPFA